MKICLDLSRHCIETAARLKVEGLIRSYFKAPAPETEGQITALTHFLENTDFQDLRTRISRVGNPCDPQGDSTAILTISKDIKSFEIHFKNQSIYQASTI